MTVRAVGLLTTLLSLTLTDTLPAQVWRVTARGGYEGVTNREAWTVIAGRVSAAAPRGDAVWIEAERLGRFGAHDLTLGGGAVFHPAPRWWLTTAFATAAEPVFSAKNAWDADITGLVARGTALGVGYRRQNYTVGTVDAVIPHLTLAVRRVTCEARLFVSRNPSNRTDVAVLLRATLALGGRATAWLGASAGRESYVVGAPPGQEVRALETISGIAGVQYATRHGMSVRLDVTVVRSEPILSRRGATIAVTRSF